MTLAGSLRSRCSFRRGAPAVLFVCAVGACGPKGGTDVGNGAQVTLDLSGYEKEMGTAQGLVLSTGERVDGVWIVVDGFRLSEAATCDVSDDPVDIEGPYVANLIDGGVLGDPPETAVDAGRYCRLRLEVHDIDADDLPEGAPEDLGGYSLLVEGARADGVPFMVRTKKRFEFRLDAKNSSFELRNGENPLFIGFDIAPWLEALELDALDGPSIVVDDQTDPSRIAAFDQALRASARLFRDEDANGNLSAPETDDDKELAVGQPD
jgi:hypothetical protein